MINLWGWLSCMFLLLVLWDEHNTQSVYQTLWIRLRLTLKRLFPSMFDGDFGPKPLCLTWPVNCCIYAWCFSSCACIVRSHLRPCCWHLSFIVAVAALLLSPSRNAMCCKMKLVCLHMRGLLMTYIVVAAKLLSLLPLHDSYVRLRTRPCCLLPLSMMQYEMHEGQVDNICRCCSCVFVVVAVMQHWYETKKGLVDNTCCCYSHVLVVIAVVQHDIEMLCTCARDLVVVATMQHDM